MKKIILLSDGTGNGAAKRHGTDVWRFYRALDLHRPDQIAFYDDGVGSQEFLPLKIIGGVFGWGLKRNVIQLYEVLCRSYQPAKDGEPADKIYLFGFSRGAFTVRILAGMIDYCGLYTDFTDEEDLHRSAVHNYGAFRSRFKHGLLSRAYRSLAKVSDEPKRTLDVDIEFLGVWDTVDAFGLPIDELAIVWDRLIFPIRFPDKRLSKKVKRACHAVSIDDERHTFHPVLWDESGEKSVRIEQVWFSGVHSDVGGGYPNNDLALVTLDWMMTRVEAGGVEGGTNDAEHPGLHFIPETRREITSHCDWHAVQHDSRAGLAAYYRYKPRDIAQLWAAAGNDVDRQQTKIHRGVFERIKGNVVPYAPTGLPSTYQVVATRNGEAPSYESDAERATRAQAMQSALDVISWRKGLYFALLITTLTLIASRFFLEWEVGGACQGLACAIDAPMKLATTVLPDFAASWFEALRQNPTWLFGFLVVFTVLFILKRKALLKTSLLTTRAWSALKGKAKATKGDAA